MSENTIEAYIAKLQDYLDHGYFEELKLGIAGYEKQKITTDPEDMFRGDSGEVAKKKAEAELAPKVARVREALNRAIRYRNHGIAPKSPVEYSRSRRRGVGYKKNV